MSRVNEARILVKSELYECKYRWHGNLCNIKQKWNHDKCWCECKNLVDSSSFKKCYVWNPSTYWAYDKP